jgi:CRISPR-associated protein Cas2
MRVFLTYDISHDGTRSKVADICLDYGLERIQYSAFVGELTGVYQKEMMGRVRKRLGERAAKVVLLPICERDWRARVEIEQEGKEADDVVGSE